MKRAQIPDDMGEKDQFVVWRREHGTKVPYTIDGRRASSTDPTTWASVDEALAAARRNPSRWAGIGYVFHESDPFVGIDLDNCLDTDGTVKPWARGLVERFADTYMEVSPSGLGLKIWARGVLASNIGKVASGDGGIEMYSHSRYFTVTGRAFNGAPLQIEDHAADLAALHEHLMRSRGRWQHQPDARGRIPHGRQHFTLVSIAGTLARRGVCPEAIEACLLTVNALQCEKPGPRENIARIARSTSLWLARREAS